MSRCQFGVRCREAGVEPHGLFEGRAGAGVDSSTTAVTSATNR